MIKKLFFVSLIGSVCALISCNKPSEFGAELDENNQVQVSQLEIPFHATTILSDPIITYDDSLLVRSLPFGVSYDPVFGTAYSEIYAQFRLSSAPNDFSDRLDSIVLTIAYDTTRNGYGNYSTPMGIDVNRLLSDISFNDTYYSNNHFEVDLNPVGAKENFVPDPDGLLSILEPTGSGDDIQTVSLPPHIRIPLSNELGLELLQLDSSILSSNDLFLAEFKGLRFTPTTTSEGLIYLDLDNRLSGIQLYYHNDQDLPRVFNIAITNFSVTTAHYKHDYHGTMVGSFLESDAENDSLLFLQGMQGVDVKIEFPDLSILEDKAINNAEFIFPLADVEMNDTTIYPPILQLILLEKGTDRNLFTIKDAQNLNAITLPQLFGGQLSTGDNDRVVYKLAITGHLQDLIEGSVSSELVLRHISKAGSANRSILHGSAHSQNPAKLMVTFTEYSSN